MNLHKIQNFILQNRADILAYGAIFIVITLSSIAPLSSGDKLNLNADFFQYASRHEAVRKSLLEYHTFPLRSHWFGGGFPTLGDPEDPSLNPLVILSVLFGTVTGLKLITYLALLVGGLGTYALARYILGYTWWGALFSGLMFGTSLFVPLRILDGNPNEVYAAFLPLCMLLIGLACRGRKIAFLILPFVFYTMLSDGKLNFFTGIFYVGMFCLLDIFPPFKTLAPQNPSRKFDIRPMKFFLLALILTFFIGMIRILPALELINAKGGIGHFELFFHPGTYRPEGVYAYTFKQLWQETLGWSEETLGWKGRLLLVTLGWHGGSGLVTIGFLPVILCGIALFVFWKKSLPWGINLVLFAWLLLAHNAPVDALKPLWKLPIFNALYRPYKYFSFQIPFAFAVASGQFFWLLAKLRPRWLEHLCAIILIVAGVWFLYPKMAKVQRDTYTFETPAEFLVPEEEFFSVQGKNLPRGRAQPFRAATYLNLLRNVGTVDWYTGIPIDENAIPKYFVDANDNYQPNPEYRGEAFFLGVKDVVEMKSALTTIEKQFADDSLVGLWHLDVVQKNLLKDSSGNSNSGRLVGIDREEALVRGKFGNALLFDGSDWVDVTPSPSLRLDGSYTLSVWINASDMPLKIERFILDTDFPRSGSRYSLVLHKGFIRFMHNFVNAGGEHALVQTPYAEAGLKQNRWHNVVAVFDQARLRLYVDGVLRAETPYTRKNTFKEDVSLRIGGRTGPPQGECFKGLIDEVAVWNRALTPEEVVNIWSAGSTRSESEGQIGTSEQLSPPSTAKTTFRPNSIIVKVNVQTPSILVINQNYHRDWHTNRGELFNRDGLLALRLRETGSYKIHLRYISRSFYTGLAISILSLAVLALICWAKGKGRLLSWSQNASPFLKRGSQAILWLID